MPAPSSTPPTPAPPPVKLQQPTFKFPFRKKATTGGAPEEITDEHEFLTLLRNEPSGGYGVSNKGMWHGGIHISETGAGQKLDLEHGVRCLADGEVIAYRLDRHYPVSQVQASNDDPVIDSPYSTSFVLVRHVMEFPKDSRLTFFSLYMHLRSFSEYPESGPWPAYWPTCFEVTQYANDPVANGSGGQVAPSSHVGLRVRAGATSNSQPVAILPQGAQVRIGKREQKWGQIVEANGVTPYPAKAGDWVDPAAVIGKWVYLGKNNVGQLEAREVLSEDAFDQVVVLPNPRPINAGDLIGHLGLYESLTAPGANRIVHIEVFCGDDIKPFLAQGREWIRDHSFRPKDWEQLGLPSEPTILRVGKGTKLYREPFQEGQDAPRTDVTLIETFAHLTKSPENRHTETASGVDGQKRNWWKVRGANMLHQDISGWVREQLFPGGRVTREFAQSWIDFETFEGEHDATHTLFATTQTYIDYAMQAAVSEPAALPNLSPLMAGVYRAVYPTGDGCRAADDLCAVYDDPWRAFSLSRLIIKHESEWANPDKWKQLTGAIEEKTGPKAQHNAEQQRIERLMWWEAVKANLPSLPDSDVFHIHPGALVGNFSGATTPTCKQCEASIALTKAFLAKISPDASGNFLDEFSSASIKLFDKYGINTCQQIKHLLAQAKHETKRFKAFRESLYYASYTGQSLYNMAPTVINNGFSRKNMTFPSPAAKIAWIQSHLIANDPAYGEHCFGSNDQPGKDFRGRGLLHLTHYETYKKCASEIGYPIDSQPELVENNPRVIIETGLWFWRDRRIGAIADNPLNTGDEGVKKVTRPINSGYKGLTERQQFKREISIIFNKYFSSGCTND